MTTVRLASTYLGTGVGTSGTINIFRVDLSQSDFSAITKIAIRDDYVISGWGGGHSGFDLDFVKLSGAITDSPETVVSLVGDPVFDFSSNGVVFQPGYLQPSNDPISNTPYLIGTTGANLYDPTTVNLAVAAGKTEDTQLSLGEGGQLTLLLPMPLPTSGKYLYFGDMGSFDQSFVLVSDEGGSTGLNDPSVPGLNQFTLYGTAGNDTIVLGVGANAHLALTNNTVFGLAGNDRLIGALADDRLYGGRGNDRLVGRSDDDWLFGEAGNDLLSGGLSRDWLSGGVGRDKLYGGRGPDAFAFDSKLSARFNVDRIYDFNPKEDTVYLDNSVFKEVGKGSLAGAVKIKNGLFWAGEKAHDANDRILYDTTTGALSYDRDGTGAAAQVQFAQLSKGLKMTYHDFFGF